MDTITKAKGLLQDAQEYLSKNPNRIAWDLRDRVLDLEKALGEFERGGSRAKEWPHGGPESFLKFFSTRLREQLDRHKRPLAHLDTTEFPLSRGTQTELKKIASRFKR